MLAHIDTTHNFKHPSCICRKDPRQTGMLRVSWCLPQTEGERQTVQHIPFSASQDLKMPYSAPATFPFTSPCTLHCAAMQDISFSSSQDLKTPCNAPPDFANHIHFVIISLSSLLAQSAHEGYIRVDLKRIPAPDVVIVAGVGLNEGGSLVHGCQSALKGDAG